MNLVLIVIPILMLLSITNGYAQQNENNDTKQSPEKIK